MPWVRDGDLRVSSPTRQRLPLLDRKMFDEAERHNLFVLQTTPLNLSYLKTYETHEKHMKNTVIFYYL